MIVGMSVGMYNIPDVHESAILMAVIIPFLFLWRKPEIFSGTAPGYYSKKDKEDNDEDHQQMPEVLYYITEEFVTAHNIARL